MCRMVGATPIAEGVSAGVERAALANAGCFWFQGRTAATSAAAAEEPSDLPAATKRSWGATRRGEELERERSRRARLPSRRTNLARID